MGDDAIDQITTRFTKLILVSVFMADVRASYRLISLNLDISLERTTKTVMC
jgi:hypothetical protein